MSAADAPAGPVVGIVMGSDSDWPVMQGAAEALREFGVPFEADVVSAHRMPEEMLAYGKQAAGRGLRVIIAGAGGAAHLPGMLASITPLPVVGVPVALKYLDGMDSLLSIVQMPAGVPVATVAVGNARNAGNLSGGARNAGLVHMTKTLAVQLGRHGITVNCVLPGTIDTPQNRQDMPQADHGKWVAPAAIADAILFLASDAARAVTGAALPVYGRS